MIAKKLWRYTQRKKDKLDVRLDISRVILNNIILHLFGTNWILKNLLVMCWYSR